RARLEPGVPAGLHGDDEKADQNGEESGPDVDPQAEEDLARVDPDRLPDRAADAVPDQVEAEDLSPLQPEAALEDEKHGDTGEVPDHFVEERGVEQGAGGQADGPGGVGLLDLEAPRQGGG